MGLLLENHYLIRRKLFKILGVDYDFYNDKQVPIAFCHQKAFKLAEAISIFTSRSQTNCLVEIKARNIIDFSATYDVMDNKIGRIIGTWQRKGFSSIIRDQWTLSTSDGNLLSLAEDSTINALIRRYLCNLIPQTFYLRQGPEVIATYTQHFNPFIFKMDVEIPRPVSDEMRLLIAAGGILLSSIEGRQQ